MGGGSGGGGKSGRTNGGGGGSFETIEQFETPYGPRYHIKDAQGNVIDLTRSGYSDKFSTKEKAEKALSEYKSKEAAKVASEKKFLEERAINEARRAEQAVSLPQPIRRVIPKSQPSPVQLSTKATDKQFKYAKDLARKTGDQRTLDNLYTKRSNGTLTKQGISKTIERLKRKRDSMEALDMFDR